MRAEINMAQDKEHLNIDLSFLDEPPEKGNSIKKKQSFPESQSSLKQRFSTNRKKSVSSKNPTGKQTNDSASVWLWGILIVVVILGSIFSDDTPSKASSNVRNSTSSRVRQSSNSDDTVVVGEYRCRRSHSNRLRQLNPDESEAQIDSARSILNGKGNELDYLKKMIDTSNVSPYSSQYEINEYNDSVQKLKAKIQRYNQKNSEFNKRIKKYNKQVKVRNNYLKTNCSPNR
jgi:hypothetical protein